MMAAAAQFVLREEASELRDLSPEVFKKRCSEESAFLNHQMHLFPDKLEPLLQRPHVQYSVN